MSATLEPFRIEGTADPAALQGIMHRPQAENGDGVVLTHGAGANCESPLLKALGDAFSTSGFTVLRFNLPFRQLRPYGPPPRGSAEGDQQGIRRAVKALRKEISGRIFLGGHSYGGRQATMVAATEAELASALLLLSYPLHPPKRPDQLRTGHFPSLRTPCLFVHGTRDGFGTLEELSAALKLVPAKTELLPVERAGHELLSKANAQQLPSAIVNTFVQFISTR
jgi:uncharacterized protein